MSEFKKNFSTPKLTLRYSGLFDFDGMYAAIIDWAKNYGYMWHEVDYKFKVPSALGSEPEFKWSMTKNITEYLKHEITIEGHGWDMREVEVEVNHKKKPLSTGRIFFTIEGKLIMDWQKKFQKGGRLGLWFGKMYFEIMEKEMSNYLDQLYYRILNLHAIMKKYFDMQSKKNVYKDYLQEG